jgi:hypothetical protein
MNRDTPEPKVGIWRAIGDLLNLSLRQVLWPEGLPALVIGGGGAVLILRTTHLPARLSVMSGLLGLAGALLAVVFAALALVVSIPSSRYLRALSETKRGMQGFLDSFLVAVGTQLGIILFALGYRLVAADVPRLVEHLAFYCLGTVFVFGLLDVAALARSLVRHGIYRAALAETEADEDQPGADVRQLRRDSGS